MNNVIKILKRNYLAIGMALILGALVVFPSVNTIVKIGPENFAGIYPMFNKDEVHYLAMAKDVGDGNYALGNAFIAEHKNEPGITPSLAEIILVFFANLFQVSIPFLFVIADFVLVFIGSITLYIFFLNISQKKYLALIFSFTFYFLFLHTFGRPINPQLSFILLAVGLNFIYKIYEKINNNTSVIKEIIYLGLVIGALLYIYPYFWTTLFVAFTVIDFYFFVKFKKFVYVKYIALLIFTIGLVGFPYLLNTLKTSSSPFYSEAIARYGMLNTHWPACYVNIAVVFLALLVLLVTKKYLQASRFIFSLSLLVSAILLNWQNVITGKYLQFSSHYYLVTILFVVIVLSIILQSLFDYLQEIKYKIKSYEVSSIILILFLFLVLGYKQIDEPSRALFTRPYPENLQEVQKYSAVFDWLNNNTEAESAVFSFDEMINTYLPIYTHNNQFSNGYSAYYLMSDEELTERWIIQNYFTAGIDDVSLAGYHRGFLGNKYIDRYQNESIRNKLIAKLTGSEVKEGELLPADFTDKFFDKYNYLHELGFGDCIKKYQVDYIVLDTSLDNFQLLKSEVEKLNVEFEVEVDDTYIYRLW